jgi:hypothetical protein
MAVVYIDIGLVLIWIGLALLAVALWMLYR